MTSRAEVAALPPELQELRVLRSLEYFGELPRDWFMEELRPAFDCLVDRGDIARCGMFDLTDKGRAALSGAKIAA